jgi:hypothetical protein
MSGLEPRTRRLLELSRTGDDPTAQQLLGLHGAVASRISTDFGTHAVDFGSSGAVKAAGTSGFVKASFVAGAMLSGAAGVYAVAGPLPEAPAPVVKQKPAPARPAERPVQPFAIEPVVLEAPAPEKSSAVRAPAQKIPNSLRLQEEAALLAKVQGALRSGDPGTALSRLESYDRSFPAGMLRAEADAARVFALCATGRVDKARAAAERYLRRYPAAPATARVREACR